MTYTKIFFLAIATVITLGVTAADSYIEYKTTAPLIDSELLSSTKHLRLGYKLDNDFYFELGPMSHGEGYEFGWKRTQNQWSFKGKVEGYHNSKNIFNNKIQTEIRYTFKP